MNGPTVGIVGLGEMGMPMLRRLTAAEVSVRAFARRSEVIDEASGLGATAVASLAELGASSDVVIICVYRDDQVRDVALGDDGLVASMRPGTVLVNHTTGRPSTGQVLAEAAAARDVAVLDCALSGGPVAVEQGTLTLLVGGDVDVLERVRPVLGTYSAPILRVGDVGDGQKVKLLNNALFGAHVALVAQVERTATALGLDPSLVLLALHECSGDSFALATAVSTGSAANLLEVAGRFIRKDVAVCTEVAAELGADLGSVLTVAQEV